ncbi:hypothetical protein [Ornithinibacillus scapharcae]|uniref:hypothetical protein n=1 Tax=Ornithinibacillus scapharcae TaxID=1147159 RepID=UPI000225B7EB|nr:hypothetical protein [Ornithinibacillus scapharcae]
MLGDSYSEDVIEKITSDAILIATTLKDQYNFITELNIIFGFNEQLSIIDVNPDGPSTPYDMKKYTRCILDQALEVIKQNK